jgi:HK97 gp10 family phage protein
MAVERGMDVALSVTGIGAAARNFEKASHFVGDYSALKVRDTCRRIVTIAKQLVPVRTGALRSAITYRSKGPYGSVGVRQAGGPEVYWRFVEFGTRHSAARPFFRPAAELGKGYFIQEMTSMGPALERTINVNVTLESFQFTPEDLLSLVDLDNL